ncbi:hypothetical protein BA739_23935 [Vibrio parahaemolyticus]|uniref:Uncharacterized protein n=2 Tax=Vibrionaceae TaxID=641 RepID=A0AAW3IRF9_VIBPH|nr:hypothetical protein ACX05_19595 [Vibrio parahaemolyticus]ODZ78796.1 hypothetical protein BBM46_05675 [Vibrio parahaemolyticus]OEA14469.1 hypothetical protein BBM54_07720 [Vibrio parahaemolyticus]OTV95991.1 hypothetical protein BA739_23935 [Vibrio parahaemolyticus]OTW00159.1 hypothetical protein BA740_23935 [Vibrio parahaemolyticus]
MGFHIDDICLNIFGLSLVAPSLNTLPSFFTPALYPMRATDIGERPMRFLKLKEVMEKTAPTRLVIFRKMNIGEFPQSVSLWDREIT